MAKNEPSYTESNSTPTPDAPRAQFEPEFVVRASSSAAVAPVPPLWKPIERSHSTAAFASRLVCAFICYTWLESSSAFLDADDNPLYPAVTVGILAYMIADAIGTVFQCTIDTMYLCSFKDIDEYGGKHMSEEMRQAFGLSDKVHDEAEQEATPIQTSEDFKQHSKRAKERYTSSNQPAPQA